jgi:MFS family permease
LKDARGFNLKEMGLYAALPLLAGTFGDLAGGFLTDWWFKRTGNVRTARRIIGFAGFALATAGMIPAALTESPYTSVWLSCLAMFGLELTVGVSWAVPLDIGADYAGSVSSVMNTFGNSGGTISPAIAGFLAHYAGWQQPFLVNAGLCVIAALLYLKIDASRRIVFVESK